MSGLIESFLQNFIIYGWILIITAIFMGTVPVVVLLRNFLLIGSKDYLILASVFVFGALTTFYTGITLQTGFMKNIMYFLPNLIGKAFDIANFFLHFFLFLHIFRLRWSKENPWVLYGGIIWFFALLLASIVIPFGVSITHPAWLIIQICRSLVGLFTAVSYVTVTPVKSTNRIIAVKYGGVILGILLTLSGVSNLIVGSYMLYLNENTIFEIPLAVLFQWLPVSGIFMLSLIQPILHLLMALILLFIALGFRESMLISHVQLLRAIELYKKIEMIPSEKVENDTLLSYIKSIPASFFEQ